MAWINTVFNRMSACTTIETNTKFLATGLIRNNIGHFFVGIFQWDIIYIYDKAYKKCTMGSMAYLERGCSVYC